MIRRPEEIDPEVRQGLEGYFSALGARGLAAVGDLAARRERQSSLVARARLHAGVPAGVRVEELAISSPEGNAIPLRIYRPADSDALGALLFIRGGGMVLGSLDSAEPTAAALARTVPAVVVSVDYRLAPEHPYPAALGDCCETLRWMLGEGAERIGCEAVGLYGLSAGGGLAVGVALRARDQGLGELAIQVLGYPMLDDRNDTPSSHEILDLGVWDREANLEAWGWYLSGAAAVSPAVPAREPALDRLPPTFIDVGDLDLFRDEDITFAARLSQAGVPVELVVHPGVVHGAEQLAPESAAALRMQSRRIDAVRRAFGRA